MAAAATAAPAASSEAPAVGVEAKIAKLVKAIEADKDKPVTPFNRILLKFPIMRKTLKTVKTVFDAADTDKNGTMEHDELRDVLMKLGAKISEEEVEEAFDSADLYDNGRLTFKEFLVCLAIGSLLGTIPFTSTEEASASASAASGDGGVRTATGVHSGLTKSDVIKSLKEKDGRALMQTFHYCLEAYACLDMKHSGVLRRDELEQALTELSAVGASASTGDRRKHPVPTAALHFLAEERFAELDFDKDGTATFAEFLFAMFTWVGIEDDEDEDGEEGATSAS